MTNEHGQHNIDTTYDGFDSECAACKGEVPDMAETHDEWATRERAFFYTQMFVERDRAERAERWITAVKALHFARGRNIFGQLVCNECSPLRPMPCPTLRALGAAELTARESRTLDLTGRTYTGPLALAPCGFLNSEHEPHTFAWGSGGDMACAGTWQACDLVQKIGDQTWVARWWVR